MDATHAHLLTNHIPILGSIFGVILLIIGMLLKNKAVEVTAISTILLASIFTIPVYLTGEEAEHKVEHLQGVSEHELEEHEEHAELSLRLMLVGGRLALMTLASYKVAPKLTKTARISTLIFTGFAFVSLIPLANHGGKIMHSELRDSVPDSQSVIEDHEDDDTH